MKRLFTLLSLLIITQWTFGQLSGTKNIPGDYATLAEAIANLNTQGVGAPGVILNLLAGNPQTAPAGGYTIGGAGTAILTTTSSTSQVTIQGNGNTITAFTPQVSGVLHDAIFEIVGADWVTITGFNMIENALNMTTAAGTNNMTEWGVALLYVTTTNGAQNNTISNCTIDLNRTYQNTFGIYSNSTHSTTAPTTSATATTTAGGNSGLAIKGNTITDVNNGIIVVGPTAAADHNEGLTIGGSITDANSITDYGTTSAISGYANVSGTVNGILVRNTRNFTVSYNTITSSNGGTTAGTLNGIQIPAFSNTPTGTFTNSINNNTISVRSGVAAGGINGINHLGTSASATSTLNINNNNFQNCGHTVAASGAITFMLNAGTHLIQNITYNTFTNLSVNTTGNVIFISNSTTLPATGTKNINYNSIVGTFNKTGAGNTLTLYYDNAGSPTGTNFNSIGNNFSNLTVTGATTIAGWANTDGGAPTKIVQYNTFNNWTGGTSSITVITANYIGGNSIFSNNTITNISGQSSISGLIVGGTGVATSMNIHTNTITNLTSTVTGGTITGLSCASPATILNVYNNIINTLSTTGATVVGLTSSGANASIYLNTINTLSTAHSTGVANGITCSGGAVVNISKNKIYDLSGNLAGASVNGLNFTGTTGTITYTISNNLIGDLRVPNGTGLNCINGINAAAYGTAVNYNVYYNTIYLEASSSSGTTFGNSCITFINSATSFNLRNNILTNRSTPAQDGSNTATNGIAACLRRSAGTAGTPPANYAATSDNNAYFCNAIDGIDNHLTYVEGTTTITNPVRTVNDLKTFMAGLTPPRDQVSIEENPDFLSTTGSDATFLHMNNANQSGIESGAATIASYTDDFDGEVRPGGAGTAPDIGADEFEGLPLYTCETPAPGNTLINPTNICLGQTVILSLEYASPGTGVSYQWQSAPIDNEDSYTNISGATSSTYSTVPTAPLYYRCVVTCQKEPSTTVSYAAQVTFSNNILTTTPDSRCGEGTLTLAATSDGGTINWYAAPTGGASIGTGSPYETPSINTTTNFYVAAEDSGPANASIGSSTTNQNGTSSWPAPYGNYDENGKHHILVLASELSTAGLGAGNLNSLAFDVAGVGTSGVHKQFTISIANTTSTALTATMQTSGFSTVFGPLDYQPVIGINTHNFSTQFYWDGASNIIVEVCFTNDATSGGSFWTQNAIHNRTTTSFNSVAYKVADNIAQCPLSTGATVSTARPNMVINGLGVCSSPRSLVVATVIPPSPFTITGNQTVCNNSAATLSVTSDPDNFDSYIWSPAIDLFTDEACSDTYTGDSRITVYFRSATAGAYAYTCSATNSDECADSESTTVTNLPVGTTIAANPVTLCQSGSSIISAVPATGYGAATLQWQNSTNNIDFTDIDGANSIPYTTPTITSTTYYKLLVKVGSVVCYESNVATVTVYNPQITGITEDTRCGLGTLTLGAIGTGGTLNWYAAPTGGSVIGTGSPWETPVITTTTNYYVADEYIEAGPGVVTLGTGASVSSLATQTPYCTSWEDGKHQYLVLSTELAAAGLAAGNITSLALNLTSVGSPAMTSFAVSLGQSSVTALTTTYETGLTPVYTSAAYTPAGTGWQTLTFSPPFTWDGTSNLVVQICYGNNTSYASNSNIYYTPTTFNSHHYGYQDNGTGCAMTAPSIFGADMNRADMRFGGTVQAICASTRSEVIATVTPPPAFSITADQTICNNAVAALDVPTIHSINYSYFIWSPASNLFTDVLCETPYTGTSTTTVYFKSATGGTYTITCNAEAQSGCTNSASTVVTNLPANVTLGASPASHCVSGSSVLTATPATGYGTATFQWQESANNVDYTDISGANSISYTTPDLTSTTYYKLLIKLGTETCYESDGLTVAVYPYPTAGATSNSPVCSGQTLSLTGTTDVGMTFSWTGPNGFASDLQNPTIPDVTTAAFGTYYFTATANGCSSITASVDVVVNQTPSALTIAPSSANICPGSIQQLVASGGLIDENISGASGTIDLTITDNSPTGINNPINVSSIPAGATIDSIIVTVNITHSWDSDVEVNLEAPNGQIINLFGEVGSSGDNFINTRISSDISKPNISLATAPFTRTYRALALSSGLIGTPAFTTTNFSDLFSTPNGNWIIRIYDDATGDIGILKNWSIKISYKASSEITWSPWGKLYLNAEADDPYAGEDAATVYTKMYTTGTFTATAASPEGCTSSASVTVTGVDYTVSGTLKYNNNAKTPMNNVTLTLNPEGYTAITDGGGNYLFEDICAGDYTLQVTTINKPVGGINSTDAIKMNNWVANQAGIQHVKFLAGEVDMDPNVSINATDALAVQNYFVFGTPFDRKVISESPWVFWQAGDVILNNSDPNRLLVNFPVTVTNSNIAIDLYGQSIGDFNSSFTPGGLKGASATMGLVYQENRLAASGVEINLPVRMVYSSSVSAISLILNFPEELLQITGVNMEENEVQPSWSVNGNELRIGWNSMQPIWSGANEELLTIRMVTSEAFSKGDAIRFELAADQLNEMADGNFDIIPDAVIGLDAVEFSAYGIGEPSDGTTISMQARPNPFADYTTLTYGIPANGHVTLQVNDMIGRKVSMIVDEYQAAGSYSVKIDAMPLQPGVYTVTMTLHTASGDMVRTIKLVRK